MLTPGVEEALEAYARARPQFSLREFRDLFVPGEEITPLLTALLPTLSTLSLGWRGSARDCTIFRIPPSDPAVIPEPSAQLLASRIGHEEALSGLEEMTEIYISQKTGKRWDDPGVLARIRSAILQQKGIYWKEGQPRRIGYRKGYAVLAYLAYHAPVYLSQFQHAFLMLLRDGLVPRHARILDVGAGPGVVSLAVAGCAAHIPGFSAELFALERSEEFLEAYRFLVGRVTRGDPTITAYPAVTGDLRRAGSLLLPSALDCIVLQNVTNELRESPEARAEYLVALSRLLSPGGCMIIIEPAEYRSSTGLRMMVHAATTGTGLHVHSPCTFSTSDRCNPERCWSFIPMPGIRSTRLMRALAGERDSFRFVNTDIKFSYAVLVRDGRRRHRIPAASGGPVTRLSALGSRTSRRANVVVGLMSGDLGTGKTHVFLVCDGTSRQPVYVVLPSFYVTPGNGSLLSAPYSGILEISGGLVRFNRRYNAWNLLLTKESRVRVREQSS